MALCEMCGREERLITAEIEGGELRVCSTCANYGEVKKEVKVPRFHSSPGFQFKQQEKVSFKVVDNCAALIRRVRESKGMKHEEFSQLLNEKGSLISKWEQGVLKPSVDTARRIGRELGIVLVEKEKEEDVEIKKSKKLESEFTLGDFVKVRKRK